MDMNLLEEKITESGLKRDFIASQIGLSRFGLRDKIINPDRWKVSEVTALVKILNLSRKDSKQIFDL